MTAARTNNMQRINEERREQAQVFLEEVEFFRTWNWSEERIANRLGYTLDSFQTRLRRHGGAM